jgi:hypothetical protein
MFASSCYEDQSLSTDSGMALCWLHEFARECRERMYHQPSLLSELDQLVEASTVTWFGEPPITLMNAGLDGGKTGVATFGDFLNHLVASGVAVDVSGFTEDTVFSPELSPHVMGSQPSVSSLTADSHTAPGKIGLRCLLIDTGTVDDTEESSVSGRYHVLSGSECETMVETVKRKLPELPANIALFRQAVVAMFKLARLVGCGEVAACWGSCRRNALVVGPFGCGRRTVVKLVSLLTGVKTLWYRGSSQWRDVLRSALLCGGLDRLPVMVVVADAHDVPGSVWLDVLSVMTVGIVSGVLEPSDEVVIYEAFKSSCDSAGMSVTPASAMILVRKTLFVVV